MPELYVSSVEGFVVGRLGTGGQNIGVRRVPPTKKGQKATLAWEVDAVTKISEREYAQFRRHYDRAVKAGELKLRTAQDFAAWCSKQADASKARGEEIAAAAKAAKDANEDAAKRAQAAADEVEAGPPGDAPPATENALQGGSKGKKGNR